MSKKPFVTKEKLEEIIEKYPTCKSRTGGICMESWIS